MCSLKNLLQSTQLAVAKSRPVSPSLLLVIILAHRICNETVIEVFPNDLFTQSMDLQPGRQEFLFFYPSYNHRDEGLSNYHWASFTTSDTRFVRLTSFTKLPSFTMPTTFNSFAKSIAFTSFTSFTWFN